MRDRVGEATSYENPHCPPPYTTVPLEGHVTLMHSSPPKRHQSLDASLHDHGSSLDASFHDRASISTQLGEASNSLILESSSAHTGRRDSSASSQRAELEMRGQLEPTPTVAPPVSNPHTSAEETSAEETAALCTVEQQRHSSSSEHFPEPSTASHSTEAAIEILSSRLANEIIGNQLGTNPARRDSPFPSAPHTPPRTLNQVPLSSSFPPARPPSPFPHGRTVPRSLPPLSLITPPESQRAHMSAPGIVVDPSQRVPFRLPPLQQLQQLSAGQSTSGHHKHRKKRVLARRHTWQTQSSGLTAVPEHNVAIIQ